MSPTPTPLSTDHEISVWIDWLAPRRSRAVSLISDLLYHAVGDHMSPADRTTCRRALALLEADAQAPLVGVKH